LIDLWPDVFGPAFIRPSCKFYIFLKVNCKRRLIKMGTNQEEYACAHCGYTADGKFKGDICPKCNQTYWKCSRCGFLITASMPPDTCSQCNEKCDFLNVTCYTPECGGPGHIDPRL
jgi:rubredoxin